MFEDEFMAYTNVDMIRKEMHETFTPYQMVRFFVNSKTSPFGLTWPLNKLNIFSKTFETPKKCPLMQQRKPTCQTLAMTM